MRYGRLAIALGCLVALLGSGPILAIATGAVDLQADWRTGSRAPVGLAPSPRDHPEAVVQVYAARALAWRGAFGVHTWIAVKDRDGERYRRYEVIGWRHYRGLPAVSVNRRPPDGRWYGSRPQLLADLRGLEAERAIEGIDAAARSYPYAKRYRVWPGPNSNTFTAHVVRRVPELRVHFPSTAVGKDYLPGAVAARAPSGSGYQFNLFGLLGVTAARVEGLELNLLGLNLGLAPSPPTLKLPGLGHVPLFDTDDRRNAPAPRGAQEDA
ncbi:MAG TPA: DUF3750 domain-containing protein [Arenicellales bacterium]|nr:DUF3750 domain-containing protein [Arenicellales bacterium]